MNAKQRIVLKTDTHALIEAPTVHLGVYTTRNHATLKGDCTVWWLEDLCDWLKTHKHWDPYITTSVPVQQPELASFKGKTSNIIE